MPGRKIADEMDAHACLDAAARSGLPRTEWARAHGLPVSVAPGRILPVPTSAYPTAATRPNNSRLDTTRLRQTFSLTLPSWQAGVERMLTEITG